MHLADKIEPVHKALHLLHKLSLSRSRDARASNDEAGPTAAREGGSGATVSDRPFSRSMKLTAGWRRTDRRRSEVGGGEGGGR